MIIQDEYGAIEVFHSDGMKPEWYCERANGGLGELIPVPVGWYWRVPIGTPEMLIDMPIGPFKTAEDAVGDTKT